MTQLQEEHNNGKSKGDKKYIILYVLLYNYIFRNHLMLNLSVTLSMIKSNNAKYMFHVTGLQHTQFSQVQQSHLAFNFCNESEQKAQIKYL